MPHPTRRTFIKSSAATAAALSAANLRAAGANDRIRLGVIGLGGQGRHHVGSLRSLKNTEVRYVCDPDQKRGEEGLQSAGDSAKLVKDLRRILDDKDIDAVTIATPDHWHAPAALLAMEAGKHVYVEKPCSHNLREGRLMIEAARKHKRIVQHGTQSRSAPFIRSAVQLLREGAIGDVLVACVWNIQFRGNIGKQKPGNPPAGFDYDLWLGPVPHLPWQANRHHYNWHWWHHYGTGDMGNDGVHDIDYARFGLGVETHPTHIAASGGKYFHDDDQEFPDTQTVTFEWPAGGSVGSDGDPNARAEPGKARQLIYEMRLWSTNYPHGVDSGVEFYGSKGMMYLSKRGHCEVFGHRNRATDIKPDGRTSLSVAEHQNNWLAAIREGKPLNADIEVAHQSTALVHLGNIATRVGRTLKFDAKNEQIIGDDEANKLLRRDYREDGHWATPKGG